MLDPFGVRIAIPLEVVPMFGVAPHTPGRVELAKAKRGRPRLCPTCGPGVGHGSSLYCCTCDRGSPELERFAARHALPDDRQARAEAERAEKARKAKKPKGKGKAKAKAGLTAKQRKALLRDAKAGEHELPIVEMFLASQAG